MREISYNDVVAQVVARYDLPTPTASTYVTTTVMGIMVNAAVQRYYALLQQARAEEYYTFEETITATADAATYDLSGLSQTFHQLRALVWVRSSQNAVLLTEAPIDELFLRDSPSESWGSPPRFRIVQELIYWLPVPAQNETVRVWYTGSPSDISGATTFRAGAGWEEFIVNDVCAQIANREDKNPSVWFAQRADAEARLTSQLRRTRGEPKQARDLSSTADYERRNRTKWLWER